MAFGVGVEKVIGARIVLVDAPLHQPHAEHAGVEVEVLLRRSRDRGDVVQPVDARHALSMEHLAPSRAAFDGGAAAERPIPLQPELAFLMRGSGAACLHVRFFAVGSDVEADGFVGAVARSGITAPMIFSSTKLTTPL